MSARDDLTAYTSSAFTEVGRQVISDHLDRCRNEVLLEAVSLARITADACGLLEQEEGRRTADAVADRIAERIKEAP